MNTRYNEIGIYTFKDFNTTDSRYKDIVIIVTPIYDCNLLIEYNHIPTLKKSKCVIDYSGNTLVGTTIKEKYINLFKSQMNTSVWNSIKDYVELLV